MKKRSSTERNANIFPGRDESGLDAEEKPNLEDEDFNEIYFKILNYIFEGSEVKYHNLRQVVDGVFLPELMKKLTGETVFKTVEKPLNYQIDRNINAVLEMLKTSNEVFNEFNFSSNDKIDEKFKQKAKKLLYLILENYFIKYDMNQIDYVIKNYCDETKLGKWPKICEKGKIFRPLLSFISGKDFSDSCDLKKCFDQSKVVYFFVGNCEFSERNVMFQLMPIMDRIKEKIPTEIFTKQEVEEIEQKKLEEEESKNVIYENEEDKKEPIKIDVKEMFVDPTRKVVHNIKLLATKFSRKKVIENFKIIRKEIVMLSQLNCQILQESIADRSSISKKLFNTKFEKRKKGYDCKKGKPDMLKGRKVVLIALTGTEQLGGEFADILKNATLIEDKEIKFYRYGAIKDLNDSSLSKKFGDDTDIVFADIPNKASWINPVFPYASYCINLVSPITINSSIRILKNYAITNTPFQNQKCNGLLFLYYGFYVGNSLSNTKRKLFSKQIDGKSILKQYINKYESLFANKMKIIPMVKSSPQCSGDNFVTTILQNDNISLVEYDAFVDYVSKFTSVFNGIAIEDILDKDKFIDSLRSFLSPKNIAKFHYSNFMFNFERLYSSLNVDQIRYDEFLISLRKYLLSDSVDETIKKSNGFKNFVETLQPELLLIDPPEISKVMKFGSGFDEVVLAIKKFIQTDEAKELFSNEERFEYFINMFSKKLFKTPQAETQLKEVLTHKSLMDTFEFYFSNNEIERFLIPVKFLSISTYLDPKDITNFVNLRFMYQGYFDKFIEKLKAIDPQLIEDYSASFFIEELEKFVRSDYFKKSLKDAYYNDGNFFRHLLNFMKSEEVSKILIEKYDCNEYARKIVENIIDYKFLGNELNISGLSNCVVERFYTNMIQLSKKESVSAIDDVISWLKKIKIVEFCPDEGRIIMKRRYEIMRKILGVYKISDFDKALIDKTSEFGEECCNYIKKNHVSDILEEDIIDYSVDETIDEIFNNLTNDHIEYDMLSLPFYQQSIMNLKSYWKAKIFCMFKMVKYEVNGETSRGRSIWSNVFTNLIQEMGIIDPNVEAEMIGGDMRSNEKRYVMAERTPVNEFTFSIEVNGDSAELAYDF